MNSSCEYSEEYYKSNNYKDYLLREGKYLATAIDLK